MMAHPLDDGRRGKPGPRPICAICGRRVIYADNPLHYREDGVWKVAHLACVTKAARDG